MRLAHEDELPGVGIRQGAKQHGVHDAEHGGRAADPEGKREQRGYREPRLPAVRPNRDACVRRGVCKPGDLVVGRLRTPTSTAAQPKV